MNYQEALEILNTKHGNKDSKKLANNTYLIRGDGFVAVKLHDTNIIEFYPEYLILNNGGWYTPTTKSRMNDYSGVYITQSQSIWYIGEYLYHNGMKLKYDGSIIDPVLPDKTLEKVKKMKAKIKTYAEKFTQKKYQEMIPTGGDCWFCSLRTVDNMTMADISNDQEHLLSHMKERYYVPSLMYNALLESGYQYPRVIVEMGITDSIKRSIIKYMQKRLLPR